ncbi:MAG TPA: Ig-like domain-containing protein [Bacteroidota bacterium]|nr:Ig-like domain-containing protein [Bacteroidota bacterium]
MNTLTEQFSLNFTYPPDTATIIPSLTVNPETPMAYDPNFGGLYPLIDYIPDTDYTIMLSTGIQDTAHDELSTPSRYSFHTPPFVITGSWMGGHTSDPIDFYFNGNIDTASILSAFSISPNVHGAFNFSSGIIFIANPAFSANTSYTVSISTVVKSSRGYHLAQPYTFSFTTGSN